MNSDLIFFTCVNVLLAWSVYVVLLTGNVSFAQGAFMAIGCYTAGLITTKLGWPLLPAIGVAGCGSALVAALIGYPALRLRGIYLMLVTLGVTVCVRIVLENMPLVGGVEGLGGMSGASVHLAAAAVALTGIVLLAVSLSPLQRILDAVREDESVAASLGIHVAYVKVLSFSAGAAIAAVAGALYGHYLSFVRPDSFDAMVSIYAVFYVILGGGNNIFGPLLGAIAMTVLPEYLRALADWRPTVFGAAILVMLLFRPDGLLPFRLRTTSARRRSMAPAEQPMKATAK